MPRSCTAACWTYEVADLVWPPFREHFVFYSIKAKFFTNWTRWRLNHHCLASSPHPIKECFHALRNCKVLSKWHLCQADNFLFAQWSRTAIWCGTQLPGASTRYAQLHSSRLDQCNYVKISIKEIHLKGCWSCILEVDSTASISQSLLSCQKAKIEANAGSLYLKSGQILIGM